MWQSLGKFVLKNRLVLLIALVVVTAVMGYFASRVKLSYEFTRAIPTDNPKYQDYLSFKEKFGDDGNLLVIGIRTDKLFEPATFNAYRSLQEKLRKVNDVEDIISVPSAINLVKDSATEKLVASRIFPDTIGSPEILDSAKNTFLGLPFYNTLLYSADSAGGPGMNAYLMGVRINRDTLNSPKRSAIVKAITDAADEFTATTKIETHLSGLPLIRTVVGDRIKNEMKYFLIGSLLLSALILLMFFRSVSTTLLSLLVVIVGVVWTLGVQGICGYKISLLTALVPPLVVVIGIPNCIYFINKYHTSYLKDISGSAEQRKSNALVDMVSKMGVVTLFCNITAAIGFTVFAFTKSAILKEFGVVAGASIMLIFVISFILLPGVLSYLAAPGDKQTKYLDNRWLTSFLLKVEHWVINHKKTVFTTTGLLLVMATIGIVKLRSVGFIVDDLPKTDKIYTDLKFFEKHFHGVMPLEIMVDTKKRKGISSRGLLVFEKVDSLAQYITGIKEMRRPLSVSEGLKFAKQAFFEGDSLNYAMPGQSDMVIVSDYLKPNRNDSGKKSNNFTRLLSTFMDSTRQYTRISVSMADVGTEKLPVLLDGIQKRAGELFDTSYNVKLTGTSITFLEGSRFIINGLKESIFWAFLLIAACMLYLFRSFRILLCSLIPNLIPLVITAGVMGWVGVPLKPSTVLVFSVALGIAIDITIRFLVNYKQELPAYKHDVDATVSASIKNTGLSIVYTSLVLVAGFVIFCFSGFGGTKALGWLTSVTLLTATLTNLILLPVLLLVFSKKKPSS